MLAEEQYKMVVGLEVHIQLNTKSKLFSTDSTTFGAEANSQTNEVSLAHPGTLPVLNEKAIRYAIKLGMACNCEISRNIYFDRKHYFYPDSPLGYQITQQNTPICKGGYVSIPIDGLEKRLQIEKIHIEADAGKSIHNQNDEYSLIDLNRAGMPLLELVTKPVLQSVAEAGSFINEIQKIVRFLKISDGNMEEGSLRCDANISISKIADEKLGQKVEIKNMNSVRNVKKALSYEFMRQAEILINSGKIVPESRLFDVSLGVTTSMREKEESHDYRYFPDPDLAPFIISESMLKEIKGSMILLPYQLRKRFIEEHGLSINEAITLSDDYKISTLLIELVRHDIQPKIASKWLIGPVKRLYNQVTNSDFNLMGEQLAKLIMLVEENKITYKNAVDLVLPKLTEGVDIDSVVDDMNLVVEADELSLSPIIDEILEQHPAEVELYKKGKKVLLQLFIGQVMKHTRGRADPKITMQLIKDKLD